MPANTPTDRLTPARISQLERLAAESRIKIIEMIARAGSGHPAGSLGMTDVLTVLYHEILNHKPNKPDWPGRDYFLLSNGHICPALYAVLNSVGYFPSIELKSLRKLNSRLQGHPVKGSPPGVENTSGPLGQGLSQACGVALALKSDQKSNRVYCMMSDGEQQEGQTWEAYMLAAKYQLDNLTGIIDRNFIQIEGKTEEIMPLETLSAKISSFGLVVYEIDAHDISLIYQTIQLANKDNKPSIIIANSTPGKGVSFMENDHRWHSGSLSEEQTKQALGELTQKLNNQSKQ